MGEILGDNFLFDKLFYFILLKNLDCVSVKDLIEDLRLN